MKLYINSTTKEIKILKDIIIIADNMQIINPTEEFVLQNGWQIYTPEEPEYEPILEPSIRQIQNAVLLKMIENSQETIKNEVKSLSDQEALKFKVLADTWQSKINKSIKKGERLFYDNKLYKVRQNHKVLENNPPSINTASLYEEINKINTGTIDDPIPYNNNMRLELGKYYIQNNIIYKCTRDSEIAVYQDLTELIDVYVILA